MQVKMKQKKQIRKKTTMKLLLLLSALLLVGIVVSLFIGRAYTFKLITVFSGVAGFTVLLAPWARKPYTKRKFVITVEDSTGKFTQDMRTFTELNTTVDELRTH